MLLILCCSFFLSVGPVAFPLGGKYGIRRFVILLCLFCGFGRIHIRGRCNEGLLEADLLLYCCTCVMRWRRLSVLPSDWQATLPRRGTTAWQSFVFRACDDKCMYVCQEFASYSLRLLVLREATPANCDRAFGGQTWPGSIAVTKLQPAYICTCVCV